MASAAPASTAERSTKRARVLDDAEEISGEGHDSLLLPLETHLEGQVHRVEPTGEERFVP